MLVNPPLSGCCAISDSESASNRKTNPAFHASRLHPELRFLSVAIRSSFLRAFHSSEQITPESPTSLVGCLFGCTHPIRRKSRGKTVKRMEVSEEDQMERGLLTVLTSHVPG